MDGPSSGGARKSVSMKKGTFDGFDDGGSQEWDRDSL